MKTIPTKFTWLLFALLLLNGQGSAEQKVAVYRSSLIVNGQPLDSDTLSFNSRGVLALVEGDLHWAKRKAIPYQSLVKMGRAAQQPASDSVFVGPALHAEIWPSAWLYGGVVDTEPTKHKPMPFRVSLRRSGAVLRQWPASPKKQVYSLQLDDVWRFARLGDELIVEPMAGSIPQRIATLSKRVIKLEKRNRPMQEGC